MFNKLKGHLAFLLFCGPDSIRRILVKRLDIGSSYTPSSWSHYCTIYTLSSRLFYNWSMNTHRSHMYDFPTYGSTYFLSLLICTQLIIFSGTTISTLNGDEGGFPKVPNLFLDSGESLCGLICKFVLRRVVKVAGLFIYITSSWSYLVMLYYSTMFYFIFLVTYYPEESFLARQTEVIIMRKFQNFFYKKPHWFMEIIWLINYIICAFSLWDPTNYTCAWKLLNEFLPTWLTSYYSGKYCLSLLIFLAISFRSPFFFNPFCSELAPTVIESRRLVHHT